MHVFGSARPHHAYLFANKRANRIKLLMHDGIGIWLAARRLHQGRFVWPSANLGAQQSLTRRNSTLWCSDCSGNASVRPA